MYSFFLWKVVVCRDENDNITSNFLFLSKVPIITEVIYDCLLVLLTVMLKQTSNLHISRDADIINHEELQCFLSYFRIMPIKRKWPLIPNGDFLTDILYISVLHALCKFQLLQNDILHSIWNCKKWLYSN